MPETTGSQPTGMQQPGGDAAAEMLQDFYRQMVLIRSFELRASEMYQRAKIGGYCHLSPLPRPGTGTGHG